MTKFEVVQSITSVAEFSKLIFDLARKSDSAETLEKELSIKITETGLETIKLIAQSGDYPLSLDGRQ